jgi:OmpA-OmpF porin, OOP family
VPGTREDKIVTLTADEIGSQIDAEGRAVLYGVLFDFDKATITQESASQLDEMAAFLKSNANLKAYVVGHTDSKGGLDYNLKLSTARAKSIVAALLEAGINPARLDAKGLGPLAPLASNNTAEGQAKNRRVELVAQ